METNATKLDKIIAAHELADSGSMATESAGLQSEPQTDSDNLIGTVGP